MLLSFPFNVQTEMIDDAILDKIKTQRGVHAVHKSSPQVDAVSQTIAEAKSPVIVAGYGCIRSDAQQLVEQLSESVNIPVTTSLKAKGVISEQSVLSLGSLGVTSNGFAYSYIVDKADLIIFLGAGFNERTSYLWDQKLIENKKIVQIDNDPDQLEKVFEADVAIHGDIREVLSGVLSNMQERDVQRKELDGIETYRDALSESSANDDSPVSSSRFALVEKFFSSLEQHFPEDICVFDDNIIFAQNFFRVSSRNRYFPNSGISSLGHAIPAAIGARFFAQKPTFAILGDGGFQMCCMEIMTAVNYNLPLNVVVFNNATMGLIRKNQFQQYHKRFIDCDFVNPDYRDLARSFGIDYKKITMQSDLDDLFSSCDLSASINLIEIIIDKDAFPGYRSGR